MALESRETTYRFAPHPAGGFILGLRIPQLLALISAGALALAALRLGGAQGLLIAVAIIATAAALVLTPIRGQTVEQWTPVLISYLSRRKTAQFRAQAAAAGHLVTLPSGDLDPQPVSDPESCPAELADLELLECELSAYDRALLGAIKDRRAGTYTAAVRVQCRAFELLSPDERRQRLEEYGGVLAALARDDSPIRRISWIERAIPGDPDALGGYVMAAKRTDADLDDAPYELVSYLRLIGRAGHVAEDHELLFAIQLDARRPVARRPVQRLGGGDIGAMALLAAEIGRLIELLDGAGITPTGVLTRRGLAAAIRDGYDPWGRRQRNRDQTSSAEGLSPHTAWPAAREEHFSHLHSDGALHCTLWVAEWPRIDVRAVFLQPLLMRADTTRTVTVCMELMGPAKAIRSTERAVTEAATEDSLRARIGQRTSQRQRQREHAVARREAELAHGHANVRYSAYVTVSVPDTGPDARDELEAAVSRVDLQAKAAPLRLERMWGQQAVAFTFGLPLCRGLK